MRELCFNFGSFFFIAVVIVVVVVAVAIVVVAVVVVTDVFYIVVVVRGKTRAVVCIYCIAGNHSLTDFYSLQIVVPGSNPSVILARALGRTVQLCM